MAEISSHDLLAAHLAKSLDAQHATLLKPILANLLQAQADGHTGCEVTAEEAEQLAPLACVSDQGDAPLYLNGQWLQFQRLWRKEQLILKRLQALATAQSAQRRLSPGLRQDAIQKGHLHKEKLNAIEQALNQRLTLLTGGPGTGKTTTLTWLLAAWLENHPDTPLALCAPTGKAAQRMRTALNNALKDLPKNLDSRTILKSLVPATLHRLLGIDALSGQARYHRKHSLPYQLVVVDEASMVDVYTMAKLVEALPENTSLILMGDPNQLASVEAGQVLEALVQRFPEAHVALTETYRFKGAIKNLAQALLEGDDETAWENIQKNSEKGLRYLGEKVMSWSELAAGYQPYLEQLKGQAAPEKKAQALLDALAHYRILTALRQGPYGATYLNQSLIEHFRNQGLLAHGRRQYFAGHAIQITENDYTLGLFNGDMGVMLPTGRHDQSVWFMSETGQLRRVPFVQLPAYETAFATTVHKAQGDEFHTATLLLPPEPHPLVTRELIYTALTRAKKQFQLIATQASFKAGIKAKTERKSGLTQ